MIWNGLEAICSRRHYVQLPRHLYSLAIFFLFCLIDFNRFLSKVLLCFRKWKRTARRTSRPMWFSYLFICSLMISISSWAEKTPWKHDHGQEWSIVTSSQVRSFWDKRSPPLLLNKFCTFFTLLLSSLPPFLSLHCFCNICWYG